MHTKIQQKIVSHDLKHLWALIDPDTEIRHASSPDAETEIGIQVYLLIYLKQKAMKIKRVI